MTTQTETEDFEQAVSTLPVREAQDSPIEKSCASVEENEDNSEERRLIAYALMVEEDEVLIPEKDTINALIVDLEHLHDSNMRPAFNLLRDVGEGEYPLGLAKLDAGLHQRAFVPAGVQGSTLISFCQEIWQRREELTAGFAARFYRRKCVATWDPPPSLLSTPVPSASPICVATWDTPASPAQDYWAKEFYVSAWNLPRRRVYNLYDEREAVREALIAEGVDVKNLWLAGHALCELYRSSDEEVIAGHREFMSWLAEENHGPSSDRW